MILFSITLGILYYFYKLYFILSYSTLSYIFILFYFILLYRFIQMISLLGTKVGIHQTLGKYLEMKNLSGFLFPSSYTWHPVPSS